jgi:hypothetical protein
MNLQKEQKRKIRKEQQEKRWEQVEAKESVDKIP